MQLATVWLEWDYGQEHVAFTTRAKAEQWVNDQEIEDGEGKILTFQDLEGEGLAGCRTIIVDP